MESVGEHTIRFLCTEQSVWLKNTHVKREKENGGSIWRVLLLVRLVIFTVFRRISGLCSSASPWVVSAWTYWKLSSLKKEGLVFTTKFSLCCCEYWLNPRERLVERLHLVKCKNFPEAPTKKFLCGNGKKDWCDFSVLIKFKIQEQTRKWLFRSFSIMLDHHRTKTKNTKQTKKKKKTNKQNNKRTKKLAFTIHKFFEVYLWEKLLVMQSWWGQLAVPDFSAQADIFCIVNTSVLYVRVCPEQVLFLSFYKGKGIFWKNQLSLFCPQITVLLLRNILL